MLLHLTVQYTWPMELLKNTCFDRSAYMAVCFFLMSDLVFQRNKTDSPHNKLSFLMSQLTGKHCLCEDGFIITLFLCVCLCVCVKFVDYYFCLFVFPSVYWQVILEKDQWKEMRKLREFGPVVIFSNFNIVNEISFRVREKLCLKC